MNTERPTPRTDAEEADKLKWESDIEVIGICKFPCVRNKKGTGVILTGHPGTEAQELAALHNEAIESIAAELAEAREELARLKAGQNNELRKTEPLRDYSEIIDHLQRCADAEDENLGDMGHSYFEQAITAIKDLQALVIDLTTYQTPPPAPKTTMEARDQE